MTSSSVRPSGLGGLTEPAPPPVPERPETALPRAIGADLKTGPSSPEPPSPFDDRDDRATTRIKVLRSPVLDTLGVPRSAPPPPEPLSTRRSGSPTAAAASSGRSNEAFPASHAGRYQRTDAPLDLVTVSADMRAPSPEAQLEHLVSDRSPSPSEPPPARPEPSSPPTSSTAIVPLTRSSSPPAALAEEPPAARDRRGTDDDASRSGSLPPRPVPSVIVDMGRSVEALVDELCESSPDAADEALRPVLAAGEDVLPALVQRFPGPLWFDRRRSHQRRPLPSDVSAIARALCAFRDRAAPYVATLLRSDNPDTRYYATLLAPVFPHRELIAPLFELVFDPDEGVRSIVLDSLKGFRHFSRDVDEHLKIVRSRAQLPQRDPNTRRIAARALGELRDPKSLAILVELLRESDPQLPDAALYALRVLTRHDFGRAYRKWASWTERNGARHRVEWLIDALLHPDEDVRSAASEELKAITQEYFGYHPSLKRREREIAQRKYQKWWDEEGKRRVTASMPPPRLGYGD
jgi:hypothetical protein